MNKYDLEKLKDSIRSRTQRINNQIMSLAETGYKVRKEMNKLDPNKYPELIKVLEEILIQIETMSGAEN